MRLVTYAADGVRRVGVRRDGAIVDAGYADMIELIRAGAEGIERASRAAASGDSVPAARVLAPVPRPGKILCSGVNYASHSDENPDAVFPEEPF